MKVRQTELILEPGQARAVALAAQGLLRPRVARATKRSVLREIQRMGALQIDTISVVARSPYIVLWSRLGEYRPEWLDQLLAERRIFEYWSHAACFLPIEDYPLYRRQMIDPGSFGWQYSHAWVSQNKLEIDRVLSTIRDQGPMRSIEFSSDQPRIAGWWEWKPAKRALEMLFTAGELMITRRENFHRVYDLRERVMPGWDDADLPDAATTSGSLVERAAKALGLSAPEWVADYFRQPKKTTPAVFAKLVHDEVLLPVSVNGFDRKLFVHRDLRDLVVKAAAGKLVPTLTTLLSPFDPIVWDRSRASQLFDFDYRLECYTPEPKRLYGYFTLPILYRGALVGRLDAKAHRKDKIFEVKVIHFEPDLVITEQMIAEVAAAIKRFANWHATPQVTVTRSEPARIRRRLQAAIKTLR